MRSGAAGGTVGYMWRGGRSCQDLPVAKAKQEILSQAGHPVAVSNPDKLYFPRAGITKLELVQYYLAVADGAR